MWKLISSILSSGVAKSAWITIASKLYDINPQTKCVWIILFSIIFLWYSINAIVSYCDWIWLDHFKDAIIANKRWVLFVFAATIFYIFWIMRPKWALFSHRFNAIFILTLVLWIFIYPFTPDFWSRFWYINWVNDAEYFAIFLPLWIMWYAIAITPRAKEWVLEKDEINEIKKTLKNPVTKKKSKAFFDMNNFSTRALITLMWIWFIFMLTWLRFHFIWVLDDTYVNTYLCIPFGVFWIWMWLTWILYEFEELRTWKLKVTTKWVEFWKESKRKTTVTEKKDWDRITEKNKSSESDEEETNTTDITESAKEQKDLKASRNYDVTKADIKLLEARYKAYDSNQSLALIPWLLAIMITIGMYFITDSDLYDFNDYWPGLVWGILFSVILLCVVFYYQNRRKRIYKQALDNSLYVDYVEIIKFDRYWPINKYTKEYNDKDYWYRVIVSDWRRKYKSEKYSDYDLWIYNPDNSIWIKKKETTSLHVGRKTYNIWDEVRMFVDNGNDNNYYIDL